MNFFELGDQIYIALDRGELSATNDLLQERLQALLIPADCKLVKINLAEEGDITLPCLAALLVFVRTRLIGSFSIEVILREEQRKIFQALRIDKFFHNLILA